MGLLAEAGCVAFSDDGRPVSSPLLMRRALEYGKGFGLTVISHCEDLDLAAGGFMNEGLTSAHLGLPAIPPEAEETMVIRDRCSRGGPEAASTWRTSPPGGASTSSAGASASGSG
jgi:dihydroorotase